MPIISPDRRSPCGLASANQQVRYLGGCFQQQNKGYDGIPILSNTTKVPNYDPAHLGEPIDPYSRPNEATAPDCSPYRDYECGDGINGNLYCGLPDPTTDFISCGVGHSSYQVGKYFNCYSASNATMSLSKCRNVGYKNLYAHKTFPGRKSFCSRELGLPDSFDWCCSCANYHAEDTTPDLTKYLEIHATVAKEDNVHTWSGDCGDPTLGCPDPITHIPSGECCTEIDCADESYYCRCCPTFTDLGTNTATYAATNEVHMDIHGNLFVDTAISSSSEEGGAEVAFGLLDEVNGNKGAVLELFCQKANLEGRPPDVKSGGGDSWHLEWHDSWICADGCGNILGSGTFVSRELDIDFSVATLHIIERNYLTHLLGCSDDCGAVFVTHDETFTVDCTNWARDYTYYFRSSSASEFWGSFSLTGGLGTPYTSAEVQSEITTLLNTWDMGDDAIYPWKTDSNLVTTGPVVYYDEGGGQPYIGATETIAPFTAEIYGKPAKIGNGILDRTWWPLAQHWCICDSIVNPGCIQYFIKDFGGWSTECGTPAATAWLTPWESSQIPQGAFTMVNQFWTTPSTCNSTGPTQIYNDVYWACAYAQTIIQGQSYNAARPCGRDRYMISQSAYCVTDTSISGDDIVLQLEDTAGLPNTTISTDDYIWVCGVPDVEDGMYIASAATAYTVTLGENLVSQSMLPEPVLLSNCGTGIVGPLRWQTLQPAICGRISITNVTSGSDAHTPLTCSVGPSDELWLANDDQIVIADAVGSSINGTWTTIMIDNKHFVLAGSDGAGLSPYIGGGYVKSYNSADYKWDDTQAKGDFSSIQWLWNFRDVGEYIRLSSSMVFNEGQVQCDAPFDPCPSISVPDCPRCNQGNCGMPWAVENIITGSHCLQITPCAPQVIFFHPDPDNQSFTKPGSTVQQGFCPGWHYVDIDSQYGSMWMAMPKVTMNDPLFQAPPCPCGTYTDPDTEITYYYCTCDFWREDDGSCIDDDPGSEDTQCKQYYPSRDQFESRMDAYPGWPAFPPGITIGCMSINDMNSNPTVCNNTKEICYPPYSDANNVFSFEPGSCDVISVFPYQTPWVTYLNKLNCVCNEGRWKNFYERNGIGCDFGNITILPPP